MNDRDAYTRYIWNEYKRHVAAAKQLLRKIEDEHVFEASQIANEWAPDAMRKLEAVYEAAKLQSAALDRSMKRKT